MPITEQEIEAAARAIFEEYTKSPCAPEWMQEVTWEEALSYTTNEHWYNIIETAKKEAKAALEAAEKVRGDK